ncbi:hypothetical protein [Lapidilactobacillus gannanensis]|jgi:hypothetical protein|uniref:Uncharacterized protein n=1 Tax=Lapidilactobacillus gannanensis TaxID=2486002 RepID=A0ABW4BJI0_9LACO|nr:hypothetical protein [Lapidilactobacillus gannanensis]MCH4057073.1 hypothetical protein [Lactobacillaceae bacterium]
MPLFAIVIDLITLGVYWLQADYLATGLTLVGFILQAALVLVLLLLTIDYQGPRLTRYRPVGYAYLTIRYGIIVLSLVINALVLFLEALAYFGINDVLFQQGAALILN